MIGALKRLFTPEPLREQAHALYVALVNQSRKPVFFSQWGVEDTLDGRFDVIVLHLSLVLERVEGDAAFTQQLMEVFFADMDRSLRELGASDTGIGKRIQKMAQAFFGRLKAYQDAKDEAALTAALQRNLYREKPQDHAKDVAAYIMRNRAHLRAQSADAISFLD